MVGYILDLNSCWRLWNPAIRNIGIVKHVWLGLPDLDVRFPVPRNRQRYVDIATESLLHTKYLTTYFYT
jgi:hypothetical protein